jgi:ABC-type molybdate transport system permease subunit
MEIFQFTSAEFQAIGLSVKVAIICAVISLPFAIGIGWLLARKRFHGQLAAWTGLFICHWCFHRLRSAMFC